MMYIVNLVKEDGGYVRLFSEYVIALMICQIQASSGNWEKVELIIHDGNRVQEWPVSNTAVVWERPKDE